MPGVLPITGEYPADWPQISDDVWKAAGSRCIRCKHPYRKGDEGRKGWSDKGKAEWTQCDMCCTHYGPIAWSLASGIGVAVSSSQQAGFLVSAGHLIFAQWRVGTVHHFDGKKNNCVWWNLLPLCQRCHLTVQARVNPEQPYMFEHSEWLKPYVAGFYAKKYLGLDLSREQVMARLDELLSLERIA